MLHKILWFSAKLGKNEINRTYFNYTFLCVLQKQDQGHQASKNHITEHPRVLIHVPEQFTKVSNGCTPNAFITLQYAHRKRPHLRTLLRLFSLSSERYTSHTFVYMFKYIYMYIYVYIYTCRYLYIHTYI